MHQHHNMKKLILLLLLFISIGANAQLYQQMPQAGYGPVKRMWIDSVLIAPTNVTSGDNLSGGREVGKVRYNITDSSWQVYTGSQWLAGNRSTGLTNFTAGNLSPLFTSSVATATSTPALTFAQVSQSQNLVFASPNGSSGNPTFRALVTGDLPSLNTLAWRITGNSGTTAGTNFLGTTDAVALILKSNNIQIGKLTHISVQFGLSTNNASGSLSTISGGENNTASGEYSVVAGGAANTTSGHDATVSGGTANTASGDYSLIAGGDENAASGYFSVIAGGDANQASGSHSIVAGGESNKSSGGYSSVFGGYANLSYGDYSSILGGQGNKSKSYSGVVAGQYNDSTNATSSTAFNTANRAFQIGIGTADNARANAMTVLFSGNVGIGTTTPATTFELVGTQRLTSLTASLPLKLDASKNIISQAIALGGSEVSGTLAVGNGGTGATSLTANALLIGNGSSAISATTTGTGILTALGINVGSAGAPVLFNGALGTPSSGTLTNATGLPEGGLSTTDITTNNTTTSKHGFFPKLTANSIYYVNNGGSLTALTVGAANTVLAGNGVTSAPTWTATSSLTGLPYWPLTGTGTLTGNTTIDGSGGPYNVTIKSNPGGLLRADGNVVTIGDPDVAQTGALMKIDAGAGTAYILSTAISGGSNGDAITLIDNTTGELGVAPNLAFNLQKQGTEIYASNGLIFAKDKAGNKTQISPHNKNGDWVYNSTNAKGSTTEINMTDAIKTIEQLTKRVYELEKKMNVKTTKPKKLIHKK